MTFIDDSLQGRSTFRAQVPETRRGVDPAGIAAVLVRRRTEQRGSDAFSGMPASADW
jgi:hypothetical protein